MRFSDNGKNGITNLRLSVGCDRGTGSSWSKTVTSDLFDMKIRLTATDSDSPPKQDSVIQIVDILCSTSC
jgi:hypothetical protein